MEIVDADTFGVPSNLGCDLFGEILWESFWHDQNCFGAEAFQCAKRISLLARNVNSRQLIGVISEHRLQRKSALAGRRGTALNGCSNGRFE